MNLNEERKITFVKKISLWWEFEAQYYWYDIKLGFRNLYYWFKTIWKDDSNLNTSLYTIIQKKLDLDAKRLRKLNWYDNSNRDAEILELGSRLISKLNEGYYSMEHYEYIKSNIYFKPLDDGNNCSTMEEDIISDNLDDYFKKYPLVYKKVILMDNPYFGKDDKKHIAMSMGHYNEERCKKLLFKILRNKLS